MKYIAAVITECESRLRADINAIIAGPGQEVRNEIEAHKQVMEAHHTALQDQDRRTSELLQQQNVKNQQVVEEFGIHKEEMRVQRNELTEQQRKQQVIFDGSQELEARLSALTNQVQALGTDAKQAIDKVDMDRQNLFSACEKEFAGLKEQMNRWFITAKESHDAGGSGRGGAMGHGASATKLDKKELAPWKLPEDLDKTAFRHWIDTVEMSLELLHGWKIPNLVLNHVRRAKVAIDTEVLTDCIQKANGDLEKMQSDMKIEHQSEDEVDQLMDYPFQERTTFLNAFLVGKLNSNLHDKTVGVEHRNGFELYRQICQIVDAVPENASFHMKNEITGLMKTYGPKVNDLKSVYGFRLLLKKRMAELKKITGEEFDAEQAKLILWNVLDNRSKEIAMAEKLDTKTFKHLYEHIDLRYKIQFGHLNYTSTSKDDPMGLALLSAPREYFEEASLNQRRLRLLQPVPPQKNINTKRATLILTRLAAKEAAINAIDVAEKATGSETARANCLLAHRAKNATDAEDEDISRRYARRRTQN